MINLFFTNPLGFFIIAVLLLAAIAVHEFSHALAAEKLGDPTARLAGRLTLNPKAHLDPLGTLLILFAGFGWGKPVPFDPFNLRNPKKDAAIISFAGPLSNFIMAIAASLILRVFYLINPSFALFGLVSEVLGLFIYFNIILGVFNLMPIHPLDGFKVVGGLLPKKYYTDWMSLERYGFIFLILLVLPIFGPSPLSKILIPLTRFFMGLLIPQATTFQGIV